MVLVCVVVVNGCGRGNGNSSGYDGGGGGVRGSISCNGDNSQEFRTYRKIVLNTLKRKMGRLRRSSASFTLFLAKSIGLL